MDGKTLLKAHKVDLKGKKSIQLILLENNKSGLYPKYGLFLVFPDGSKKFVSSADTPEDAQKKFDSYCASNDFRKINVNHF